MGAICRAVKQTGADVVLPAGQSAIGLLSSRGDCLPESATIAPMPNRNVFDIAVDKWLTAEFLARSELPTPPTILCGGGGSFEQRVRNLRFPVLVKAVRGMGGSGIECFDNPTDLLQSPIAGSDKFIAQSFVTGYDIDCSVLCRDGHILAHTIQRSFVPGDGSYGPSTRLDFVHDEETFDIVRRLMRELNWSGVAHVDLRYDEQDRQIKILEINPRFWITVVGSLKAGINFPYLLSLAALNVDFAAPEYRLMRYVGTRAAVEMLPWFCLGRHAGGLNIQDTGLALAWKDPLPEILGRCVLASRKLLRMIRPSV